MLSLPSFNRKCRVGQGVKTPPFHGGITGSNPVRGTKKLLVVSSQLLAKKAFHSERLFLFGAVGCCNSILL